jgi:hypothetical protein
MHHSRPTLQPLYRNWDPQTGDQSARSCPMDFLATFEDVWRDGVIAENLGSKGVGSATKRGQRMVPSLLMTQTSLYPW